MKADRPIPLGLRWVRACRARLLTRDPERGATLVMALVAMMLSSLLVASIATYAQVSNRTTQTYKDLRAERYRAEGAIKAAVNWARDNPSVAVDPLTGNPDDCLYYMETDGLDPITVSCGAEAGSGSGVVENPGLVPPEAILALGQRHHQSPVYNSADCNGASFGVLTRIGNWLQAGGRINATATQPKWREEGIKFRRHEGLGTTFFGLIPGTNCDTPVNRGNPDDVVFTIQGKMVTAGQFDFGYGGRRVVDPRDGGIVPSEDHDEWILSRYTDGPGIGTPGTRPAGRDAAGTAEDSDPARLIGGAKGAGNNTPAVNPVGDIRPEWHAVGYDPSDHVLRDRSGADLPERTHAYLLDPATGRLTPALSGGTRACTGDRSSPIVFLPGWYRDSRVLNDYTANPSTSCRNRTFWFAPDVARTVDGHLTVVLDDAPLNADGTPNPNSTTTGAYYFDFRSTPNSISCGDLPSESAGAGEGLSTVTGPRHRWCVGASPNHSPRVVAGWPNSWSPQGVSPTDPGEQHGPVRIDVAFEQAEIDKAEWTLIGSVGFEQLGNWINLEGAQRAGDGEAATWQPDCLPVIGCAWFFGERTLTFHSFSPSTTSPPIEQPGASSGRVYVDFRYAYQNGHRIPSAKLEIRAKALGVADTLCATVDLPVAGHEYSSAFDSGSLGDQFTYRTDDATAAQIAENCGSVRQLNGLFLHYKMGGSWVNWAGSERPTVHLDGASVDYQAFGGASFPAPQGGEGSSSDQVSARSDCDPDKPGAQFIFGGQSHVYVPDGSLEVCAGPYPTDPANHQQIGVYQMPAVEPLRPVPGGVTNGGSTNLGSGGSTPYTTPADGTNLTDAERIGEPDLRRALRFRWGQNTWFGVCCYRVHEARTNLVMQSYTPPPGYQVERIDARVAYSPRPQAQVFDLVSASDEASQLRTVRGTRDIGLLWDQVVSVQNADATVLYDRANPAGALMTPEDLQGSASARTITWAARRPCGHGVVGWVWEGLLGLFRDRDCPDWNELDGIELDVTLSPAGSNANRPLLLPASGCTTAYPNYGVGAGLPDCAVLRSNANVVGQLPSTIWENASQYSNWNGRFSVKGTVYTPSGAVEVDDIDVAYPAATRGMVVRHLRLSGWVARPGYEGVSVGDGWSEPVATPRDAIFVACVQSEERRTDGEECDPETDRVLTRANVSFEVHADELTASVPKIRWWSTDR